MANALLCREKMILATAAIKEGRVQDKSVFQMIAETRKCYHTYEQYLRRLKHLYTRTKHIFNTISYHKLDVLDEYAEVHDFDPIAVRHHYNRIVFVLEMSLVIGESILDAMKNAKSVVKCARENLETMTDCCKNIRRLQQIEANCSLFPWFLRSSETADVNTTVHEKVSAESSNQQNENAPRLKASKSSLSEQPSIQGIPLVEASEGKSPPKKLPRIAMASKPRVLNPHEISVGSCRLKATKSCEKILRSKIVENENLRLNTAITRKSDLKIQKKASHSLIKISSGSKTSEEEFRAQNKIRGRFKSDLEARPPLPILVSFDATAPSGSTNFPEVGSPIIRYDIKHEASHKNSFSEEKNGKYEKSKSRQRNCSQRRSKSKGRVLAVRKLPKIS
jgi:hypothetical protein